ncbi:hypothetical protein AVEN_75386-1 [Araneus ventricosus]|uniref:Uncharacterized protein n=1 Tax=Araneus ventricosus TaxID=182803 RepID=A0A4Y2HWR9_ARAVE|nr:hypothetical protein AVEN_75386-1 [Araneus ventricosus]
MDDNPPLCVPASTSGMGPELPHRTLESRFSFSLLSANDAFVIIEVLWVQIVISVNLQRPESASVHRAFGNRGLSLRATPACNHPHIRGCFCQMSILDGVRGQRSARGNTRTTVVANANGKQTEEQPFEMFDMFTICFIVRTGFFGKGTSTLH